jgi:uncharacterized membrane protein
MRKYNMEAKIAIYQSHEEALEAINRLKLSNYPVKNLSLIGEAEIINDQMYLKSLIPLKTAPIQIGAAAGLITGVLTGLGVFAIPGFGLLYGAGAIVGAMAGLDLGLIGGGVATLLMNIGIKKDEVIRYEEQIRMGKFLVVASGTEKEIRRAENILKFEDSLLQLN